MSKFLIEISSPDGKFQEFEIEKALNWLCNHDGIVIRAIYTVKEIKENQ